MHPLSLFPSLLTWSLVAPFLLRIVLGAVLLHWVYVSMKDPSVSAKAKFLGVIEGLAGILFVIGLWTQAAALLAVVDLFARLIGRAARKAFLTDGINYYLILFAIALSLLFSGPGFWAFDLPL